MNESELLKDHDWRIKSLMIAEAEANERNPEFNDGQDKVVKIVGSINDGGRKYSYPLPSASALFLEVATDKYVNAKKLKQRILLEKYNGGIKENLVFEYFEEYFSLVIFSFTAIESFCNQSIPEDYCYEEERKKELKKHDKESVERYVDIKTKIGNILPEIFKSPQIKGVNLWNKFCDLKDIRD